MAKSDLSIYSVITGTGSFIPENRVKNDVFLNYDFLEKDGSQIAKSNAEIISKFQEITAIDERRYASNDMVTSDLAYGAGKAAIESANIDKEELDYIIVAHNFGDVKAGETRSDIVPSLASRVKTLLGIKNPNTVAYDTTFGCPGWLQALIQADYYIKSGDAKSALVIGADVLSRVSDPHDRDSMIYADGAGAVVLQGKASETPIGILAHATRSDTMLYSKLLHMGPSYNPDLASTGNMYLKMNGRRLYQYALATVPLAIRTCLERAKVSLSEVKKVLIHQANAKMDDAILERLYAQCKTAIPEHIMPMTIANLGNSSVATVPTLLDIIMRGGLKPHTIERDNLLIFASVGAGMNINAMVYKA